MQKKAGKDVDVLTGGVAVKQAYIVYFMHMAIIIFCYYTKQKERQGKNGRETTIVIAF
jgi:hypothetical protein